MITREIPREEWAAFFDSFSRRHEGWRVTLEVLGPDIGAQKEARELPLGGITAELNGKDRIDVMVGERADDHITHSISQPTHVRLEETDGGVHQALEIESSGAPTVLLRFLPAIASELVDGRRVRKGGDL